MIILYELSRLTYKIIYDYTNARDTPDWAQSSLLLRLGGWRIGE